MSQAVAGTPRRPFDTSRRALRSEVLVVLALTFLASLAYALVRFTYDALHVPVDVPVTVEYVPPVLDPYAFANRLIGEVVQILPVLLVAHLLARTGETMRRIGFDLSRPRFDLTFGAALALIATAVATGALALSHALDLPVRPIVGVNPDAHGAALPLLIFVSAVAGITEEVVVNGYLLTRLDDLGWRPSRALMASALLRGSYHLYQGIGGFASNVAIGLVAGTIFQRNKRVMPLVIAHFLIDVVAFGVSLVWPDRPGWLR